METSVSERRNENEENGNFSSLVSIHYPAVVTDVSKMLETLGGIKTISTIYSEKNRRLELRWRPDDSYCKPTFATKKSVAGLLLKIKFRKKRGEKTGVILSCEPIGSVTEEYQFRNICDFQYLATSTDECFYDAIVPQSLDPEWLNSDSPYFLPPVLFSRVDSAQNFNFSKVPAAEKKTSVIGRLRGKRYGSAKCSTFEATEVPTTAPKDVPAGGVISAKLISSDLLEHMKSERPIYSKSAIKGISNLPELQIKCILPCVAYYYLNGPWRTLWVRLGYDPRKDPSARIYQTLDFRAKRHFTRDEIKLKRLGVASVAHKFTNSAGKDLPMCSKVSTETKEKNKNETQEEYIFKPNIIPPSRQCHYQYCDIHVPEIKAMLENLEDVSESAVCHEIHGWLPPGMASSCRKIMNKYVSEEIKRRKESLDLADSNLILDMANTLSSDSESDLSDPEQFNE